MALELRKTGSLEAVQEGASELFALLPASRDEMTVLQG